MTGANGSNGSNGETKIGTTVVKKGLAQMLKGGVIVSGSHAFIKFSLLMCLDRIDADGFFFVSDRWML